MALQQITPVDKKKKLSPLEILATSIGIVGDVAGVAGNVGGMFKKKKSALSALEGLA